jgi:diketogulonate reductase-like aldo/keto reductase
VASNSKVLPSNASRRGTIAACERSLKRLKTDHLDSYLLQWRGSAQCRRSAASLAAKSKPGKTRKAKAAKKTKTA